MPDDGLYIQLSKPLCREQRRKSQQEGEMEGELHVSNIGRNSCGNDEDWTGDKEKFNFYVTYFQMLPLMNQTHSSTHLKRTIMDTIFQFYFAVGLTWATFWTTRFLMVGMEKAALQVKRHTKP